MRSIVSRLSTTVYPIPPAAVRFVPVREIGWYSSAPSASRSAFRERQCLAVCTRAAGVHPPYASQACCERVSIGAHDHRRARAAHLERGDDRVALLDVRAHIGRRRVRGGARGQLARPAVLGAAEPEVEELRGDVRELWRR
jgi:hypothetical protein